MHMSFEEGVAMMSKKIAATIQEEENIRHRMARLNERLALLTATRTRLLAMGPGLRESVIARLQRIFPDESWIK